MNRQLAAYSLCLLLGSSLWAKIPPALPSPTRPITTPLDSIGTERRDGKYFVLHKVTQGQTLYAIARRYNTSVEIIKAANQGLGDGVQYNQVLRIPQPEPMLSRKEERAVEKAARKEEKREEKAARKAEKDDKSTDVHVVEAGQTLYSLAVKYTVLMADLRRWNNLTNDNILVGQALIISEKGFAARQTGNTPPPAKPETKPETPKKEAIKVEPKPERTEPSRPTNPVDRSVAGEERPPKPGEPGSRLPSKGRRVAEIGMAERIEADESSNKFLALHRSAPVGSLVQVRNDINNQSLWVKVIGRLPATGVNERVLIKLSAKAFEKLSPNNQGFRAEVSYIVP